MSRCVISLGLACWMALAFCAPASAAVGDPLPQDMSEALRAAREVKDPANRVKALFLVGTRVAPLDPDLGIRILREISAASASAGDKLRGASLGVTYAAGGVRRPGREFILALAHHDLEATLDALLKLRGRVLPEALRELLADLLARDPARFEEVLSSIAQEARLTWRLDAFELVREASRDLERARKLAQALHDPGLRAEAWRSAINHQWGRDTRAALADYAAAVAAGMNPAALECGVAYDTAAIRARDWAAEHPAEARELVAGLSGRAAAPAVLGGVAIGLAAKDPSAATALVDRITDPGMAAEALIAVAAADSTRAPALLERAEALVARLPNGLVRAMLHGRGGQAALPASPAIAARLTGKSLAEAERASGSLYGVMLPAGMYPSDRRLIMAMAIVQLLPLDRPGSLAAMRRNRALLTAETPACDDWYYRTYWRGGLWIGVCAALARFDLARAIELARGSAPGKEDSRQLALLAGNLAPTDPALAARVAARIRSPEQRDLAHAAIAWALFHTGPERALAHARLIGSRTGRAATLRSLVETVLPTWRDEPPITVEDLAFAERVCEEIPPGIARSDALEVVAKAWAERDPDHALRIARSIPDAGPRSDALAAALEGVVAKDPALAGRLSEQIPDYTTRGEFLDAALDLLIKRSVPDATAFAAGQKDVALRSRLLQRLAQSLLGSDPEAAVTLAEKMPDATNASYLLAGIAAAIAESNPERALEVARRIRSDVSRRDALYAAFQGFAESDGDGTRRLGIVAEVIPLHRGWDRSEHRADGILRAMAVSLAPAVASRPAGELLALLAQHLDRRPAEVVRYTGDTWSPRRNTSLFRRALAVALAPEHLDRALAVAESLPAAECTGAVTALAAAAAPGQPNAVLALESRMPTDPERARFLLAMARALRAANPPRARDASAHARAIARALLDPRVRAALLSDLADYELGR